MRAHVGGNTRDDPSSGGPTVTYVIAEPCVDVKDKACIEECPVDCIYEASGRCTSTRTSAWTAGGRASRSARSRRSTTRTTSPEQWSEYYKANVEFFDDLGSPGGAAKMGEIDKDHPIIATLPLRVHGD